MAGLAKGVCNNANYPNLACDPNFTLVNIDSLKWAANGKLTGFVKLKTPIVDFLHLGHYWYEKCRAEKVILSLQ